jgi:glutamine synthetase
VIRGKACHAEFLASYLRSGIGMTEAMQSFTMLDQLVPEGRFGPAGEFRLMPDLATFAALPYAPGVARLLCDLTLPDGRPWEACPRTFLRAMLDRAGAMGLALQAAFENEFTLARREGDRWVPLDRSPYGSTTGMDSAGPVMLDLVRALRAQGVRPEQCHPELGPGQQELSVRFAPGLAAADNQVTFRETARGVARTHGLHASFAPKPYADEAGNGSHIHWSLWDRRGANAFHDADGAHGVSAAGYAFIAGVLAHLPALVALTAPSANSYRRLKPRSWCGAYAVWGPDNREAAVRIPSTRRTLEMESTNLELKPCDPSCNPYLALGGLLACGLDGLARGLEPGEPALADPDTYGEAERARRGIRLLPQSLGEALDALERDAVLGEAMGPVLFTEYLAVKRAEARAFAAQDAAFELAQHFDRY